MIRLEETLSSVCLRIDQHSGLNAGCDYHRIVSMRMGQASIDSVALCVA